MIENLAGLKQFYLRRDDAESRLTQTEANLVHVDALVAEIAPQLESLAQQAQALRSYRGAEGELRRLQQVTFGAQAARLLARLQTAQQRDERAREDLESVRARAGELGAADDALVLAFGEREICWGIMLARNVRVRFDKTVIPSNLSKSPVHRLVHAIRPNI